MGRKPETRLRDDTVEETRKKRQPKSKKEGLDSSCGTVLLPGYASEYKHGSYMMIGLSRPRYEMGATPMPLQSTHSEVPAESSAS